MEHFPMELRLNPRGGRVAFRQHYDLDDNAISEPDAPERAWHEFFWAPVTGWLDRRVLTDDQVADWIPLYVESETPRRLLDDVIANAEERKVAVRIPQHARRRDAETRPGQQWIAWWISEAGLTVELLQPPLQGLWTAVYAEEETDG